MTTGRINQVTIANSRSLNSNAGALSFSKQTSVPGFRLSNLYEFVIVTGISSLQSLSRPSCDGSLTFTR
jgi:hypothetical protein